MKLKISKHAINRFNERIQFKNIPSKDDIHRIITSSYYNGFKINVGRGNDFLIKVPKKFNKTQYYLCCVQVDDIVYIKTIICEEHAIANYQLILK